MNLAPLTPLVVGLALAALTAAGARSRHEVKGDLHTFRFPKAIAYLMFGIALLFAGAPFLPGAAGNADFVTFVGFFWGIALFTVFAGVYFLRYRVMIDGDRVSHGAYSMRDFTISDIATATLKKGGRSAELVIALRNGRKANFSGMLADFDSLVSLLGGDGAH